MKKTFLSLTLLLCCGTNINAMNFEEELILKKMCKEINIEEFERRKKGKGYSGYTILPSNKINTDNIEDVEYNWNKVLWNELYRHFVRSVGTSNRRDNTYLITLLIKSGVNPTELFEFADSWRTTNLYFALRYSELNILDILLKSKHIKINVKDGNGEPAIFEIIHRHGHRNDEIELLKKFIGCDANINITNSKGDNFIMKLLASNFLATNVLKILNFLIFSLNINVGNQNETGQNVFHILAEQGTKDQGIGYTPSINFGATHHFKPIKNIVFILREKNSRLLKMPDYKGNTPLDIALRPFSLILNESYYKNSGMYGSLYIPHYMPIEFPSLFISNEKRKDEFDKLQSYYLNKLNEFTKSLHSQQKKLSSDITNFEIKHMDLTDQLTTILKNPPETDVFECIADKIKKLTDKEAIKKNKDEIEKSFDLIVQLLEAKDVASYFKSMHK